MVQHPALRPPSLYRHQQYRQDHVRNMTALCRSADDALGKEIDVDGQIGKAFQCTDVGDPDPVGHIHVELLIEGIFEGGLSP